MECNIRNAMASILQFRDWLKDKINKARIAEVKEKKVKERKIFKKEKSLESQ